MCGIVGVIKLNGDAVDRSVVERMTSILRHRGPDDQALWCEGLIGLGHSRLSIIDLSTGGSQPMHTADERYVMTYNGEIYNYVELRDELEQLGFQCRSQSDTEVVLNSYLAWGEECLKRFNGMWALMVYAGVTSFVYLVLLVLNMVAIKWKLPRIAAESGESSPYQK